MPKIRKGREVTVFEQKFIAEYLIDPNGIRAYKRARGGKVSYKDARSEAIKLLAKPHIRAEIDAAMSAVSRRAKLKAAKVVQGFAKIALADPLDFIDRDTGNLLPMDQVPYRARLAVQKIKAKVTERKVTFGKDEETDQETKTEVVTEIVEIGLNDRNSALDKLAKHLGLYLKDNEQKHGVKSQAEADALRDKLKQRGFNLDAVNAPSAN